MVDAPDAADVEVAEPEMVGTPEAADVDLDAPLRVGGALFSRLKPSIMSSMPRSFHSSSGGGLIEFAVFVCSLNREARGCAGVSISSLMAVPRQWEIPMLGEAIDDRRWVNAWTADGQAIGRADSLCGIPSLSFVNEIARKWYRRSKGVPKKSRGLFVVKVGVTLISPDKLGVLGFHIWTLRHTCLGEYCS
jgi:hypothetical protein